MGKNGKKRKSEDSEEKIRGKIRKLECKLPGNKTRRRVISSSSSSSENEPDDVTEINDGNLSSAIPDMPAARPTAVACTSNQTPGLSELPDDEIAPSDDPGLDEKILELLGDAPKIDTEFGKPIHKDIAARWNDILNKGLEKEVKEKLLKEYLIPSNCDLLVAPTLNPEVKAALSEPLIKRDLGLAAKQKQTGIAIAALSQALEMVIAKDMSSENLLKAISDACRILCDSHYTDTKTLREFVLSTINNDLKEAVTESVRNKYLFGDNMSENKKSAKSIQKSGEVLKQTQKPSIFNKANFALNNKNNYKTPHRKQPPTGSNRTNAGKFRPAWRTSRSSDHSPAPPPPPPPQYHASRAPPSRRRHYN